MKKIHGLLMVLIVGIFAAASFLAYFNVMRSERTRPSDVTEFAIHEGESSSTIVNRLQSSGLVRYPTVVLWYVWTHNVIFLPGTYPIPEQYSDASLLKYLSSTQTKARKLTIPEGYNREQIAAEVNSLGLSGAVFMRITVGKEGVLFPDTYNVDNKTTEIDLANRMLDQYHKKTNSLSLSTNDLNLASIVEREAGKDSDRPLIAGIYKNRLKVGKPLEADPTVQYAKYTDLMQAPSKDGIANYWAPISKADYTGVLSPYNTYIHPGLPPAPICNPGIKSITAVLNATQTDAMYFFHTSDGRIITARTLDEHNANKATYLK